MNCVIVALLMRKLNDLLEKIYRETDLLSSFERRKILIHEMQELEGKTIHCFTCPGTCCTSQANSMQITPIEALEILSSLKSDEWTAEEKESFKKRMQETILNFRLDVEIYTGKKNSAGLRKTYTCPFFMNGSKGCGLSRGAKPYGCLGFNPQTSEDNGKSCSSNKPILEKREELFFSKENLVNTALREDLNLSWLKQSIPQALLDVVNKLYT